MVLEWKKKQHPKHKAARRHTKSWKISYIKISLYKLRNYVHNCAAHQLWRDCVRIFNGSPFQMYLTFAIMIMIISLFVCDFQRNAYRAEIKQNFGIARYVWRTMIRNGNCIISANTLSHTCPLWKYDFASTTVIQV